MGGERLRRAQRIRSAKLGLMDAAASPERTRKRPGSGRRLRANQALLGAHMSIAGGKQLAVRRAVDAGCKVLQIFVKNSNQWSAPELQEEEVHAFRTERKKARLRAVVAHSSYLINLASPQEPLWKRSVSAMLDELRRSERLQLSHLVTHPGAHVGSGESAGIRRVAEAIDRIHEECDADFPRIALETTAGQGTSLGHRFEHLRDIVSACRNPERVDLCVDTCHVFAAGYDVRSGESCRQVFEELDRIVGLQKLALFHFNDSKKPLGSRVDRHEHIGKGAIGSEGFEWILNERRFSKIPKILETPKGENLEYDIENLRLLRSLIQEAED